MTATEDRPVDILLALSELAHAIEVDFHDQSHVRTVCAAAQEIRRLRTQLASTIAEHETVTAALLMRVQALEKALGWFVERRRPIQAKIDLHGPRDLATAMRQAFADASDALAATAEG